MGAARPTTMVREISSTLPQRPSNTTTSSTRMGWLIAI